MLKKVLVYIGLLLILLSVALGIWYSTRVKAINEDVSRFCETMLPSLISESLSTPFVHRVTDSLGTEESGLRFQFDFDPSVAVLMSSIVSEYFDPNAAGVAVDAPVQGITIVKTTYTNGVVKVSKVFVK